MKSKFGINPWVWFVLLILHVTADASELNSGLSSKEAAEQCREAAGNPFHPDHPGVGVAKTSAIKVDSARRICEQALNLNDSDPYLSAILGRVEYQAAKQSGSYSKAADYFVKAVRYNDPMGIFYWALYYEKGLNPVTANQNLAVELYERAARLGYPSAMNNLGNAYHHGHGVKVDLDRAASWYKKSVDAGNTVSLVNLGWLHVQLAEDSVEGLDTADLRNAHIVMRFYDHMGKAQNYMEEAYLQGYDPALNELKKLNEYGYGLF